MPQASPDDARIHAQVALLRALLDQRSLKQAESAVSQTEVRGFSPDVAMLEVAVAALDVAGVDRDNMLPTRLADRYLPEVTFKNRRQMQERVRFALYAATAMRSGLELDLVGDTYWWQDDRLWRYALWAAVIYIRGCSELTRREMTAFIADVAGALSIEL
jgi:hypothetical protein